MGRPEQPSSQNSIVEAGIAGPAALHHLAFDAVGSGIVIADATRPDNPVIDVNPAFERMTGYRREEMLGRNCRMLQGPATDPAAIEEMRAGMTALREINVTVLNQRRDGTPFWNELRITPVLAPDGTPTHFVGIQTDVTARKQAAIRAGFLAQASDRLGVSLDYHAALAATAELAVPDLGDLFLVDLVDDDHHVTRLATNVRGLGREAADELGRTWRTRGDDRHGTAEAVRTGRSTLVASVEQAGSPSLDRDGARLQQITGACLLSYVTVPIASRGRTLGALTMATTSQSGRRLDEADLLLMEDLARRTALAIDNALLFTEAEAAVRARDQFLSIAAHELRTPVSSIKGYAQMLLRSQRKGAIPADRLKRSLETIDSATDRLSLLTSDLLDVSRIRLGHLPLRPIAFDFAGKVRAVIDNHLDASGNRHRFDVSVAPGDYIVDADVDRIDQVLSNLFENAAKYSPDSDRIAVGLCVDNDLIRLTVQDHGIGLPFGGTTGIFEPFERAPNALRHELPGLGLGLYICRGILERHGGHIWAESEGEGTGTTFIVTIPTLGHGPDIDAGQPEAFRVGY